MGLSRRAYARHRGVAENAVRKALAAGRISLEPDGTIDPAKADAAWQTASDPARVQERKPVAREQQPRAKAPDAKPVPASAVEAVRETLRESGEAAPAAGGMTFVQARTANEVMKAQERRVRLQKLKGDLVDRSRAVETIFSAARRERDAWVQWPARVAALMAADLRVDAHEMETVLDKYVRRHLAELSDVRIELR
jgi:hypothetical protein